MHANVHTDRAGGGGGSWRLPPDETLQVADPKQKEEQRQINVKGYHCSHDLNGEGNRELFPVSKTIRYPTPGSVNPEVSLWVMDISNVSNIRKWEVIRPAALEGQ
uniref:Dipeptidylpeptidase IV N-terminal domain-containing protein n=1 Tax=Anopheles merus TaxID=30066 RepID=A0A182VLT5_ANOME